MLGQTCLVFVFKYTYSLMSYVNVPHVILGGLEIQA